MRLRSSLLFPFAVLIVAAVVATAIPLHVVKIRALRKVLHEHDLAIAESVHKSIGIHMAKEAKDVAALARLAKDSSVLKSAMARFLETGGLDGNGDSGPLRAGIAALDLGSAVRHLVVVDPRGRLVCGQGAGEPGGVYDVWGMAEVLAGRPETITASADREGRKVRAISRFEANGKMLGAIALVMDIDSDFAKFFAETYGCDVSLGNLDGIFASSLPANLRNKIDETLMIEALRQRRPQCQDLPEVSRTVHYAPVQVADEMFCLIVETDTSASRALLARKRVEAIFVTLGILVVVLAVGLSLAARLIVPLRRLKRDAEAVVADLTGADVAAEKGSEVQSLVRAFDHMVRAVKSHIDERKKAEDELARHRDHLEYLVRERTAELEQTQRSLLDAARQAGIAEIATDVLHNVGNVLNSVGVATSSLKGRVHRLRLDGLTRLAELIESRKEDLGAFVTEHEQGRKLPGFLTALGRYLTDERKRMSDELAELTSHVEHISEIVSVQQSYSGRGGLTECVTMDELIDSAVKINSAGLRRHGVGLKVEPSGLPPALLDRQRILQILINLINNAKYAVSAVDREDKEIATRVSKPAEDRIRIEVSDNGVGIAKENLARVFAHGFTTKKHGHGFGLHSGANAAREMGGSLTAYSEGIGKGARFVLDLPFNAGGKNGE
ncbi:GHKL domain-containing protein [Candidatus Sumerlaeota bacterium]|nr:GHKL domain-containing protein [Candidatus Sumerlaeota bacterium]